MNNYVVYRHTSPNGKIYVGITSQKPNVRWDSGYGYKNNKYFFRAIKKYGWKNFKHDVLLENLSKEEACLEEMRLIDFYHSNVKEFGYNLSNGGEAVRKGAILSYETKQKMSEAKKGKYVGSKNPRSKKVNQYDGEGNLIKTWESATMAAQFLNLGRTAVAECCRGKAKTVGGFTWKYVN